MIMAIALGETREATKDSEKTQGRRCGMKQAMGILLIIAIAIAFVINGYLVCIHDPPREISMAKTHQTPPLRIDPR
jgi:hypothetical protein